MKFFFLGKLRTCTRDCHWKETHHPQHQKGKILVVTVFRSFAHPLVLFWPQARQRELPCSQHSQTHAASSLPVALLSVGEAVLTNTAGSCWRKVVDFLWSSERCTDQISCSADYKRVGQSRSAGFWAAHAGKQIPQLENPERNEN